LSLEITSAARLQETPQMQLLKDCANNVDRAIRGNYLTGQEATNLERVLNLIWDLHEAVDRFLQPAIRP
jgi:hypothetical protein